MVHIYVYWRIQWEAGLEQRDGMLMHMQGQPLDLKVAAFMVGLDREAPLFVWHASGKVIGIPTDMHITLEEMRSRTGKAGDQASPFLLQDRPAQGKGSTTTSTLHLYNPLATGTWSISIFNSFTRFAILLGGGGGWENPALMAVRPQQTAAGKV